jgi:hypothetical protein
MGGDSLHFGPLLNLFILGVMLDDLIVTTFAFGMMDDGYTSCDDMIMDYYGNASHTTILVRQNYNVFSLQVK